MKTTWATKEKECKLGGAESATDNSPGEDMSELTAHEEPSYLSFARANVRDGVTTSPKVVEALLARIDRDANTLKGREVS